MIASSCSFVPRKAQSPFSLPFFNLHSYCNALEIYLIHKSHNSTYFFVTFLLFLSQKHVTAFVLHFKHNNLFSFFIFYILFFTFITETRRIERSPHFSLSPMPKLPSSFSADRMFYNLLYLIMQGTVIVHYQTHFK